MNNATAFRVPGKILLAGEYAVLEGCEALSSAVSLHTTVKKRTLGTRETFEVPDGVVSCVIEELNSRNIPISQISLEIDSSALYIKSKSPPIKMGLGSSACVAVGVSCAYLEALNLFDDEALCFSVSYESHKRFTRGLGSGIDVATSFYGGTISFRRSPNKPLICKRKLNLHTDKLMVVHTGHKQSTSDFLARIAVAKKNNVTAYEQAISGIEKATQAIITCLCVEKNTPWITLRKAVLAHNQYMQQLQEIAGINIFAPSHKKLNAIAENYGGFSKPSGAGGGDISLCFISEGQINFQRELKRQGFEILPLTFCPTGVEYYQEHM